MRLIHGRRFASWSCAQCTCVHPVAAVQLGRVVIRIADKVGLRALGETRWALAAVKIAQYVQEPARAPLSAFCGFAKKKTGL